MTDPKKEVLQPNEFVCKMCWKIKTNVMFRITAHDADMGNFNACGEGFSICDDCFDEVSSIIDIKASELVDTITGMVDKYPESVKGLRTIYSIVERRIATLTTFRDKLKELIRERDSRRRLQEDRQDG